MSIRSIVPLTALTLLLLAGRPAGADAQEAAERLGSGAAPAAGGDRAAATPTGADRSLKGLTRNLDPGRFNLSPKGGSGLIEAVSPYTLPRWKVGMAGSVMNFDRNPGDIDFFEYGYHLAIGLPGRLELFVRATPVLRTNSVNQEPYGYPVPPLDLFVDVYPTVAARSTPYFLFAQEAPYKSYYVNHVRIDPPGHGAFASSSGDSAAGLKLNLLSEERSDPFAFGLRAYMELPTERPTYNTGSWRQAAGVSGKNDVGVEALFAKRIKAVELIWNVGYEHVGDPPRGLRVQFVDSSRIGTPGFLVGTPVETRLDLHDQLSLTVGTSGHVFTIYHLPFWGIAEFSHLRYVAGGTPVERLVHPAELRLGLQANVPKFNRLSIGAAWQLLLNDGGNGTTRRSQFHTPDGRGDINFTEGVDSARAAIYEPLFAAQGVSFRENSSKVFATNNPAFDADRNIPAGETPVVSMGGGNILAFLTWRIN